MDTQGPGWHGQYPAQFHSHQMGLGSILTGLGQGQAQKQQRLTGTKWNKKQLSGLVLDLPAVPTPKTHSPGSLGSEASLHCILRSQSVPSAPELWLKITMGDSSLQLGLEGAKADPAPMGCHALHRRELMGLQWP